MIAISSSGAKSYAGYKKKNDRGADAEQFGMTPKGAQAESGVRAHVVHMSVAPDNSVRSAIVQAALGDRGGAPTVSGAAQGEEDETKVEVFYNIVAQPDGSKVVQIITKYPDGTTRVTTTRVPGSVDIKGGLSAAGGGELGDAEDMRRAVKVL